MKTNIFRSSCNHLRENTLKGFKQRLKVLSKLVFIHENTYSVMLFILSFIYIYSYIYLFEVILK
jgi:hypothetical protein